MPHSQISCVTNLRSQITLSTAKFQHFVNRLYESYCVKMNIVDWVLEQVRVTSNLIHSLKLLNGLYYDI